jgi:hypothetical protein
MCFCYDLLAACKCLPENSHGTSNTHACLYDNNSLVADAIVHVMDTLQEFVPRDNLVAICVAVCEVSGDGRALADDLCMVRKPQDLKERAVDLQRRQKLRFANTAISV